MKNLLLASALLLAFAGTSHAGTWTGDHFTVTYDDEFWGASFAGGSGSAFSFAGLDDLGMTASSNGAKNFWKYDGWNGYSSLSIVAHAGFRLAGVTSGATGAISALTGFASNTEAHTGVSTQSYWSGVSGHLGTSATNDQFSIVGWGSNVNVFNSSGHTSFAQQVSAAVLDYSTNGWTQVIGTGSSATAKQYTAYFNVVTAPIPEPESYALLLAGLGLMGTVARRRSRNAA